MIQGGQDWTGNLVSNTGQHDPRGQDWTGNLVSNHNHDRDG